jgi:serine/threonine protein kinase
MGKSAHENLIGRTIAGKFLVESAIGSGAMGAVFRARQIALEKTVAIKVLHGEHADDPAFAARFQREAKAASRLNHPNSMQVIDFGAEPDGLLYIAMEYLDGRSLHRVLHEDGALPAPRIADIVMQTLAALAVAHDMGVVHRDLKPENVVILRGTDDDGRSKDLVKVCDFGIAKITDSRAYRGKDERESNAPVTTAGFLVGTPEYMSPEQSRGEKLDARSDLYSVGVILYEMLTGRVPFIAESAIGVVLRHITEEPPRPSQLVAAVDSRLETICLRALRKPRDARYQSAREMRADLRAVAEQRGPLSSVPDLSSVPNVQVRSSEPATGNAATLPMDSGALLSPRAYDSFPKPTLAGTSSSVGRRPSRLTKVALVATLTGALAAATVLAIVARSKRVGGALARVDPSGVASAPATILQSSGSDDDVPPLESASTSGAARAPAASHGSHSVGAPLPAKPTPSSTVVPSTASLAEAPVPQVATAPPASAGQGASSIASADPSFDPGRAFVEIGLINAQGVRESAVRGALHGAGFASCYRTALRAQGSRVTGVGTLNLSIDENGVGRSAIVTGAGFLPGLTRCLQGAASGVSVSKSQVDSGGGTAEVTLAFKAP